MLLVFCNHITNRLTYIFKLYLHEILGLEINFTTSKEDFVAYQGPKISYASHPLTDELFFLSKPLLFENDIKQMDLTVFEWQGLKVFFPTNKTSALPFDPFAAGFYLVSRYEEYQ